MDEKTLYDMMEFPDPYTEEEEKNVFEEYQCTQDNNLVNDIFMHNYGLITSVISKYLNKGIAREDLISIGSIGLIKAIKIFDLSFNNKFSTFAVVCIKNEIKREFMNLAKQPRTISLEEPIKGKEKLTLKDTIEDENSNMEERLEILDSAKRVTQLAKSILKDKYFTILSDMCGLTDGIKLTIKEIAHKYNICEERVVFLYKKALKIVRQYILDHNLMDSF